MSTQMRKSYINSNKQVNVSNPLPGCDVDTPDPKRRWLGSSHPGHTAWEGGKKIKKCSRVETFFDL